LRLLLPDSSLFPGVAARPRLALDAPSCSLERFPIAWNHVIDKESLKIKTLEQVLIEKVCHFFENLL
jgi:hypothetical protein